MKKIVFIFISGLAFLSACSTAGTKNKRNTASVREPNNGKIVAACGPAIRKYIVEEYAAIEGCRTKSRGNYSHVCYGYVTRNGSVSADIFDNRQFQVMVKVSRAGDSCKVVGYAQSAQDRLKTEDGLNGRVISEEGDNAGPGLCGGEFEPLEPCP